MEGRKRAVQKTQRASSNRFDILSISTSAENLDDFIKELENLRNKKEITMEGRKRVVQKTQRASSNRFDKLGISMAADNPDDFIKELVNRRSKKKEITMEGRERVVPKTQRASSNRFDILSTSTAVPDVDDSAPCFIDALPDHLLEEILSFVSIPSIFRAKGVCRRWRDLVSLKGFPYNKDPQPWYFMFTSHESNSGHVHDPVQRSWYAGLKLPCIEAHHWLTSSSNGLVCFMDDVNEITSRVFICNPITKAWKRIDDPPRGRFSSFSALSIYSSPSFPGYKIAVVELRKMKWDSLQCEVCIHVYDSTTRSWDTPMKETMMGWRGGTESVICGGVLYCSIDSSLTVTREGMGSRIIVYDLAKGATSSLLRSSIPTPCSLTCGQLMNLRERMIMVGGIEMRNRRGFIEGVGVWELAEREWREIARMPYRYLKRFRRLDDMFASTGAGDLIYLQRYGAPALMIFDINDREWRWSAKCPVPKGSSFVGDTGISFLPRPEISP